MQLSLLFLPLISTKANGRIPDLNKSNKVSTRTILILAGAALFLFLSIAYVSTAISYNNRSKTLKAMIAGKQKNQANVFDAMWKIISQKAQLTEDYKDSFSKVLTDMITARYDKGDGTMMKWIQEANPTLDPALYLDLSATIESQRIGFVNEQKELIDMTVQFNTLISRFPGLWFLSGEEPIDPKLILSTRTEEAQRTGKDDEVELFKKDTLKK